ncbi:MAG: hypothetical protein KAS88_00250 [Deltaproteobacteria bacterium]|nr:hypothetical protein [Deltaproteobacteria bacterium]
MIIDKTKEECAHIPHSLDGEVLLEERKDEDGNSKGFLTIKPEYLKHYGETKSSEELAELGFGKYMNTIASVMARSDIKGRPPEVIVG